MGRLEFDPSWVVVRVLMLLPLARLTGPAGPVLRQTVLGSRLREDD